MITSVSANHAAFVGSIPENYDRFLGPVLFEPYAMDLASRLNPPVNACVLEIACGTGILTRHLRERMGRSAKIVATDLNEAMLSYASEKLPAAEVVEWKQADAMELPFADQSFDAVVCQFGLMFVRDKGKVAREAFRVLRPDGTFLFSVWDAIEQNELQLVADRVISKFFPENPPDFYQVPFSWHDPEVIRLLLTASGFTNVQLSELSLTATGASAPDVARGLIHGNPVINTIRERRESSIPEIEAALAAELAAQCGFAPVRAKMRALICSAIR